MVQKLAACVHTISAQIENGRIVYVKPFAISAINRPYFDDKEIYLYLKNKSATFRKNQQMFRFIVAIVHTTPFLNSAVSIGPLLCERKA